jgi:hypothetical protein
MLRMAIRIGVTEDEQTGIDQVELGMEAYPEFGTELRPLIARVVLDLSRSAIPELG